MSTQGESTVFKVNPDGAVSSYDTSGQAIIAQHELERMRHAPGVPADTTGLADPTRIPASELGPLLKNQIDAIGSYDDAKSVAKAFDRVQYIAARTGRPMANSVLVDAAAAIRANPRSTVEVLARLKMTEPKFVAASKAMVLGYGTTI